MRINYLGAIFLEENYIGTLFFKIVQKLANARV